MQNNHNLVNFLFCGWTDRWTDRSNVHFAVFVGIDGAKPQYIKFRYMCFLFRKGHLSIYLLMVFLVMNQMPTLRRDSKVSRTKNGLDTAID